MKLLCKANGGTALRDASLKAGNTLETIFHIVVGKTYSVVGMNLWKNGLSFLVRDDTGYPNWYPVELFEVTESRLPPWWLFADAPGDDSDLQAVWGYAELLTFQHYNGILERISEELKVFCREADRAEEFAITPFASGEF